MPARATGRSAILATATRYFGHFEGDPQNYRAKDEVKNFRETVDALKQMREKVTGAGIFTAEELDAIDDEVLALIDSSVERAHRPDAGRGHDDVRCLHRLLRRRVMAVLTMRDALNQALHEEMERDPSVIVMGEDVAGGSGGTSGNIEAAGAFSVSPRG